MIAAIMAVPKRQEAVAQLRALIEPFVSQVLVYEDTEYKGQPWNYSRVLCSALPIAKPNEPVLILTDDAVTVPDWYARWAALHTAARHDVYCLFTRQRHLFKPEHLARGYVKKVHKGGFYDQAAVFINRPSLGWDVADWLARYGATWPGLKNKTQHYDIVVQEYLIAHDIPWVVSVPTLFDHRQDLKSLLGHRIGGSPMYVGQVAGHADL